jgi:hypothetical protein
MTKLFHGFVVVSLLFQRDSCLFFKRKTCCGSAVAVLSACRFVGFVGAANAAPLRLLAFAVEVYSVCGVGKCESVFD